MTLRSLERLRQNIPEAERVAVPKYFSVIVVVVPAVRIYDLAWICICTIAVSFGSLLVNGLVDARGADVTNLLPVLRLNQYGATLALVRTSQLCGSTHAANVTVSVALFAVLSCAARVVLAIRLSTK